jgi:hypothetical protein
MLSSEYLSAQRYKMYLPRRNMRKRVFEVGRIREEGSGKVIIASAIKIGAGVFIGLRHSDAIQQAMKMGKFLRGEKLQDGFITSSLKFLNRKEALVYAKEQGQFKRGQLGTLSGARSYYDGPELYSEDLW